MSSMMAKMRRNLSMLLAMLHRRNEIRDAGHVACNTAAPAEALSRGNPLRGVALLGSNLKKLS